MPRAALLNRGIARRSANAAIGEQDADPRSLSGNSAQFVLGAYGNKAHLADDRLLGTARTFLTRRIHSVSWRGEPALVETPRPRRPIGEQGALPETPDAANGEVQEPALLGRPQTALYSPIATRLSRGTRRTLMICALFPHRRPDAAPCSPSCSIRNARYSPIDASLFSHLRLRAALTRLSIGRPPSFERRHSAIMQRVRARQRPHLAPVKAGALAIFAYRAPWPVSEICRRSRFATSVDLPPSTNSPLPENGASRTNRAINNGFKIRTATGRIIHRLYREIPENIINEFYRYFPRRFPRGFNALRFSVENRDSENPCFGNIFRRFFDSQSDPFRVISRETTHRRGRKYASKHDGEPAPSGGSTRAGLQGNHDLASERARQRDQPLRQRPPLPISARGRDGSTRSSFHAREGKEVM